MRDITCGGNYVPNKGLTESQVSTLGRTFVTSLSLYLLDVSREDKDKAFVFVEAFNFEVTKTLRIFDKVFDDDYDMVYFLENPSSIEVVQDTAIRLHYGESAVTYFAEDGKILIESLVSDSATYEFDAPDSISRLLSRILSIYGWSN